mgnify:FL=1
MIDNVYPNDLVVEILEEYEDMKQTRSNWERMWQEIAEYMIPQRADFTVKQSSGEQRREKIYEGTAVRALERSAAGLHNTLTSSAVPWFHLKVQRALQEDRDVQLWIEEAERRLYDVFASPDSNFHPALHEFYLDLVGFGTGILYVVDEPGMGPRYRSYFLGQCFLMQDNLSRVDGVLRVYEHTARQLVQEYGEEGVPESVLRSYNSKDENKKFECLHCVKKRRNHDVNAVGNLNMPWMSVYILMDQKHVLRESGFEEFPYIVSRWSRNSEELYGRGPGTSALPDVKMINLMEKVGLKALQKMVDPPLLVPDDGFLNPVRTQPGGLNYYRAGLGRDDRIIPLQTGGRLDLNDAKIGQVRESINKTFFLDLLELPGPTAADGDVMRFSATEINARQRDRLSVLGPIVSRQEVEFLAPMVMRTLGVMESNGMLPPAPPALINADFRVEYANPVSISMRTGELNSVAQLIQFLLPIAQIDPSVVQRFNTGRIAELGAEILKVPPSVLRTEEEMQELMLAQRQAQEEQMLLQSNLQVAEADNLVSQSRRNDAQAGLAVAKSQLPV